MVRTLLAIAVFAAWCSQAFAAEIVGEWARTDGKAHVRMEPCNGNQICGAVTWLKDPNGPGKIGQKVFYDMAPSGTNAWAGKAFNPDDGKEYKGKMSLSGDSLTTAGCMFGGLICKSFNWTRLK